MTNKEKTKVFAAELAAIKNEEIRNLTEKAISNISPKFFDAPASSTGKYHPAWACVQHGLVNHTKCVVYLAENLCQVTPGVNSDIVIAAAILHDSCKSGLNWERKHTVHEHPLLVCGLLDEKDLSQDEAALWEQICFVISTHMGKFTTSPRSSVTLPTPTTPDQLVLHQADYLASRKEISLTYFEAPKDVEPVSEPLATEKQVNFIRFLISTGMKAGYDMSGFGLVKHNELSSCQAGVMIAQIKEYINFKEELRIPTH